MRKTVFQKIKSDRGASLAVALLLFLVCAAVGAVVLTAATGTAGRMSELSRMDQRYYNVSSAADLLIDQLCGKKVTIERIQTTTAVTTLTYNGTTVSTSGPETETTYAVEVNDVSYTGITDGLSFLSTRAVKLLFGSHESDNAVLSSSQVMGFTFSNGETGGTISIKHGDGFRELNLVDIPWSMRSDGTLDLTISSGEAQNRYTIVLTLVPETEETVTTIESVPTTEPSGNGYKKTATTEVIKKSTIQWKIGGIRKEVAQPNEQTSGNG